MEVYDIFLDKICFLDIFLLSESLCQSEATLGFVHLGTFKIWRHLFLPEAIVLTNG